MKHKLQFPNYNCEYIIDEKLSKHSNFIIHQITPHLFQINDGEKIFEVNLDEIKNGLAKACLNGNIFPFEIHPFYGEEFEKISSRTQLTHKQVIIKAPMPGLISKIKVNLNQNVKSGESLLVLEAMKMENELKAPQSGIVKQINVKLGDPIEKNANLLVIES